MNKKHLSLLCSSILASILIIVCFCFAQLLPNIANAETNTSATQNSSVAQDSSTPKEQTTIDQSDLEIQSSENEKSTTIYFTNDIHGYFNNGQSGGMSYGTLKGLKNTATEENPVYIVDAGDHASGSNNANYTLGDRIMELMDMVDYDFLVPGNHEFDYGSAKFLNDFSKKQHYYACNFYHGSPYERGENILDSYKVVKGANGEKIAFIGIMTLKTISSSAPGYYQDEKGNWIMFIDGPNYPEKDALYNKVNETITEIKNKEGSDTICIGVGHLGYDRSGVQKEIDSTTVINKSHGLSAFIDGHSHTIINTTIKDADGKDVILAQAASGLDAESTVETDGINRIGELIIKDGKITSTKILNKDSDKIKTTKPDEEVVAKEKEIIDEVTVALNEEVAFNPIENDGSKEVQRSKTNNLADLVTDSMLYYSRSFPDDDGNIVAADVALFNGGGIRSSLQNNTCYLYSCMSVLPFINSFSIAELTGQKLLDALEFGARGYPKGAGGFMQCAGMEYYIDDQIESTVQVENEIWTGPPTGQYRVNGVKIYNTTSGKYEDLNLNKTYKVAGPDYLIVNYGSGFTMLSGSKSHSYKNTITYKCFAWYLSSFGQNPSQSLQNNALPYLSTATNPLSKITGYENYKINYENLGGAGRIKTGRYIPDPEPKPIIEDDLASATSTSSATGDNLQLYMIVFLILCSATLCGTSRLKASLRKNNSKHTYNKKGLRN